MVCRPSAPRRRSRRPCASGRGGFCRRGEGLRQQRSRDADGAPSGLAGDLGAQHFERAHERGGVGGQRHAQLGRRIRGYEGETCPRVLLDERAYVVADAVEPRFAVAPVLGHDARRGVDDEHDVGVRREGLGGTAGDARAQQHREAGEHEQQAQGPQATMPGERPTIGDRHSGRLRRTHQRPGCDDGDRRAQQRDQEGLSTGWKITVAPSTAPRRDRAGRSRAARSTGSGCRSRPPAPRRAARSPPAPAPG